MTLRFAQRWTDLVMRCIEIVSYSILINNTPQDSFKPTRGIRQGDLLLPYLFILCIEAFSNLLSYAENFGAISSIPIALGGRIHISRIFFVYVSLLFCKANSLVWSGLIHILEMYERAFGQRLNQDKTSIYFNKNTF